MHISVVRVCQTVTTPCRSAIAKPLHRRVVQRAEGGWVHRRFWPLPIVRRGWHTDPLLERTCSG